MALDSPASVPGATDLYEHSPADFADCLLSVKARAAGCDQLVTFDRGMKSLPGVNVLPD